MTKKRIYHLAPNNSKKTVSYSRQLRAPQILLFFLFLFFSSCASTPPVTTGHQIEIKINGYQEPQLVIGVHYNQKQLVQDTLTANAEGQFIFKGEESLKGGVYMVILSPDNTYFEMLVDRNDQHFKVETSMEDLTGNLKFQGSKTNQLFQEYTSFLKEKRKKALDLQTKIGKEKSDVPSEIQQQLDAIDISVALFQKQFIAKHPDSFAATIVKASMKAEIPEFEGNEEQIKQQNYDYYKAHYFDNIDFADERMIRTPILVRKVENYLKQMVLTIPDSINLEVDRIIGAAASNPETFKYWVTQFLNKYAKMSTELVGLDGVYVHIAQTYYCNENSKVDWISDEQRQNICKDAAKYNSILIGTPMVNIPFKNQKGQVTKLSDIESEITVVYFYRPDCSYCEASIPKAQAFFKDYQSKGVKVVAVCNKRGDDTPKCWETVKEMKMENWINVNDPFAQGMSKFKVETFPTIFVLDKDKKIISKGIGSDQLKEVVDFHLKKLER